jgi:site-specific recombinase XerC
MPSVASSSESPLPLPAAQPFPAAPDASGWIEKYLEHVRVERRLAARTLELYAFHLKSLTDNVAEAKLSLDRVQTAHVRRWMAQLHASGREPRGIALVLSCWRSFYRWLGHEGLIGFNPVQDVHAPKAGRPLPKALGVDDAVRLAELYDPEADPWTEARDGAIVEVLYGCGLRVSELTGLDAQPSGTARGWIDLEALEANVLGKGGKRRIVPLGSTRQGALAAAPPPLGVRIRHRQGRRRPRRDRARGIARRRVPGLGGVQPGSRIRARCWSFVPTSASTRPSSSAGVRARRPARGRFGIDSDGVRLVHGESDGLPGLIVDRYGDTLVAQFLSAGAERWKTVLADALLAATGLSSLYERSDTSSRELEGLPGRPAGCAARARPNWRSASTAGADAGHRHRPQDRLLPRPARQPPALSAEHARRLGAAAGAELLLLHRRLHRRRAGGRGGARDWSIDSSGPRWSGRGRTWR